MRFGSEVNLRPSVNMRGVEQHLGPLQSTLGPNALAHGFSDRRRQADQVGRNNHRTLPVAVLEGEGLGKQIGLDLLVRMIATCIPRQENRLLGRNFHPRQSHLPLRRVIGADRQWVEERQQGTRDRAYHDSQSQFLIHGFAPAWMS